MDEINEKVYLSNLFSFYQNLLTSKQVLYFDDYYNLDYSLQEIADSEGVSKNAVWDNINKTVILLKEYEEKLHLFELNNKRSVLYNELKQHLDEKGLEILNKLTEME